MVAHAVNFLHYQVDTLPAKRHLIHQSLTLICTIADYKTIADH